MGKDDRKICLSLKDIKVNWTDFNKCLKEDLNRIFVINDIAKMTQQFRLLEQENMKRIAEQIVENRFSLADVVHNFSFNEKVTIDKINTDGLYEELVKKISNIKDVEEFETDIKDIFSGQKDNWQDIFQEKYKKWSKRNPVISMFLVLIVLQIFINITSDLISDAITNSKIGLKNKPNNDSDVIIVIPENSKVFIIEADDPTQPYFKVQYTDPETGEEYEGYVSKQNLKATSSQIDE